MNGEHPWACQALAQLPPPPPFLDVYAGGQHRAGLSRPPSHAADGERPDSRLQRALKARLFERSGRSIALTDTGRLVYCYAGEISALGRDFQDALHDRPRGSLPKVLVHRLLAPASTLREEVWITYIDGPLDRLLADLALHVLELVISDYPA